MLVSAALLGESSSRESSSSLSWIISESSALDIVKVRVIKRYEKEISCAIGLQWLKGR